MFTTENSEYGQGQCDEMNLAATVLMKRGIEETNACDLVNNAINSHALNDYRGLLERVYDALGTAPDNRVFE